MSELIRAQQVFKSFGNKTKRVEVLKGIDLVFEQGGNGEDKVQDPVLVKGIEDLMDARVCADDLLESFTGDLKNLRLG